MSPWLETQWTSHESAAPLIKKTQEAIGKRKYTFFCTWAPEAENQWQFLKPLRNAKAKAKRLLSRKGEKRLDVYYVCLACIYHIFFLFLILCYFDVVGDYGRQAQYGGVLKYKQNK